MFLDRTTSSIDGENGLKNYLRQIVHRRRKDDQAPPSTTPASNISPDTTVYLNQIYKVYQTPAGDFTALTGVDLEVKTGEFVAVIGKSGSGKSTLINMITGIDRPTLGEIYVAGTPVHQLAESQISPWRGRNVGVIFQFFQLLPTLTLVENIMVAMEFCDMYSRRERRERAMHLLDLVDLAGQADKFPAMVSGGQQQRAAIARALANDPAILVADEPTGSLDSRTAETIFRLFEDFVAQGRTILMVTHDRDLASRVSRAILIANGELINQPIAHALPGLDTKHLVDLSTQLTPVTYPGGTTIFDEGDTADQFYIIIKGQIEIVKEHPSGRELILATLGRGQYFGEMGLMAQAGVRNATARVAASSEAILMGLDKNAFTQLMQDSELTQADIATLMRQRVSTHHLLSVLPDTPGIASDNAARFYEVLSYEPGQLIFQPGDPADKFYLVTKGEVEILLSKLESQPETKLISGQYFGEHGLLRHGERRRTARASQAIETETEVVAIGREEFHRLMTDEKIVADEIALAMHQYAMENLKTFLPDLRRHGGKSDLLKNLNFDND